MNASTWAIKRPIPPILFFMLFCIAGLIGFNKLAVQHLPDLDYPTVIVTASLPGATPTTLENEVTRPLEDGLSTIAQIKHISSEITNGTSVTTVTFNLEKSSLQAITDVRNAVEQKKSLLPTAMQDPSISNVTTSGGALLTFVVDSDYMSEAELSWFVDNDITKRLLSVSGVGEVTRIGGVDREIRIELDPSLLGSLGLTAADVSAQVKKIIEEHPSGKVNLGNYEQSIRTVSSVKSKQDIASLPITLSDGRVIKISQIGRVIDGGAEPTSLALVDGTEAVTFQIKRSQGFSEVGVAERVREEVKHFTAGYSGVTIKEINNTITPVEDNYKAAMSTLYEGAVLAVLAVFMFLRDVRATLVAAVALPLSIIPTFALMWVLDFQLNSITLLSLTLIIGVLVDDAIVEIENIERHLALGATPLKAAMEAANEIGLAVIATSFTLIAVFLPTAFMSGMAGSFFKQFGWTASIAVFFSLLVARLLTPMMAAYFMKSHKVSDKPLPKDSALKQSYIRLVEKSLNNPLKTMLVALGFFVASFVILMTLPTNFVDAEDKNQVILQIETPPGATLPKIVSVAKQVSSLLQKYEGVTSVFVEAGEGGDVTKARVIAQLYPLTQGERMTQQEIEADVRQSLVNFPGVRISVGGTNSAQQLSVMLVGEDSKLLTNSINNIVTELKQHPLIGSVRTSAGAQTPEVLVKPDYAKAAALGVSVDAISNALRVGYVGDFEQYLPRINLPSRQLYVKTQLPLDERSQFSVLRNALVEGREGLIPLSAVADFEVTGGPARIERLDRYRSVTVYVDTLNKPMGEISKVVNSLDALKQLPPGVRQVTSGTAEQQQELFSGFGFAMLAGVLCVYTVLVLLFHDFLQPLTILVALPLSAGGAFAGLAITGHSLSLSSLIGLIMLMGIVSKNSILLVEFAIMSKAEFGLTSKEAILDACRKRARPVIMTTFAMVAGMLPMAMQLGVPSAFRSAMAIAVIGGLITSTALSLVVVPAMYIVIDRLKQRIKRPLTKHTDVGHTKPLVAE
ncbi:ACR family transporter (plasmid) [Alteromonas sp. I4]|nr:ACR family transporter [Alteromonas sp. I4]